MINIVPLIFDFINLFCNCVCVSSSSHLRNWNLDSRLSLKS